MRVSLSTPPPHASFLAAVVAGVPILVGFFLWHWVSIAPVWGVLIEGAVAFPIAAVGIAWSWRVARRAGAFPPPLGGAAFGGVFAAGVVVALVIGLARDRGPSEMTGPDIIAVLAVASIPVVLIALLGWRIGRGPGAVSFALAALPLDLHLGGTVMHLGGTTIALQLFAVLVTTYVAAGAILATVERWIASPSGSTGPV